MNTDYLIKEVNKQKRDLLPYGNQKFTTGRGFTMSNTDANLQSIQYFGILMESGLPICLERIQFENSKDVYLLIKKSFSYYPFPILFYALQYSEDKFLKRIGQDYAYCEEVKDDLYLIQKNLQAAI